MLPGTMERVADLQMSGTAAARVRWPAASGGAAPGLVLVVGHDDALCRRLCAWLGAVVLSAAPADAGATLEWAADHAAELDADAARLLVAGEGAAAAHVLRLALDARDRRWPRIARQVLLDPVVDAWPARPLAGVAPATVVTSRRGEDVAARLRAGGVAVEQVRDLEHFVPTRGGAMRKIVVSTFVSLDGVVQDPHRWSFDFQDEDNARDALELLRGSEALLLGRVTYEGFAEAWPSRQDPLGFADRINRMPKYVISSTLRDPGWNNTIVLDGDGADEVRRLKRQPGGDLLLYGSPTLTQSLMAHDLVDEYRLLMSPVVLGQGQRLFPDGMPRKKLQLAGAKPYAGGMVRLQLQPASVGAEAAVLV
jgi:dihydrofolate reductase